MSNEDNIDPITTQLAKINETRRQTEIESRLAALEISDRGNRELIAALQAIVTEQHQENEKLRRVIYRLLDQQNGAQLPLQGSPEPVAMTTALIPSSAETLALTDSTTIAAPSHNAETSIESTAPTETNDADFVGGASKLPADAVATIDVATAAARGMKAVRMLLGNSPPEFGRVFSEFMENRGLVDSNRDSALGYLARYFMVTRRIHDLAEIGDTDEALLDLQNHLLKDEGASPTTRKLGPGHFKTFFNHVIIPALGRLREKAAQESGNSAVATNNDAANAAPVGSGGMLDTIPAGYEVKKQNSGRFEDLLVRSDPRFKKKFYANRPLSHLNFKNLNPNLKSALNYFAAYCEDILKIESLDEIKAPKRVLQAFLSYFDEQQDVSLTARKLHPGFIESFLTDVVTPVSMLISEEAQANSNNASILSDGGLEAPLGPNSSRTNAGRDAESLIEADPHMDEPSKLFLQHVAAFARAGLIHMMKHAFVNQAQKVRATQLGITPETDGATLVREDLTEASVAKIFWALVKAYHGGGQSQVIKLTKTALLSYTDVQLYYGKPEITNLLVRQGLIDQNGSLTYDIKSEPTDKAVEVWVSAGKAVTAALTSNSGTQLDTSPVGMGEAVVVNAAAKEIGNAKGLLSVYPEAVTRNYPANFKTLELEARAGQISQREAIHLAELLLFLHANVTRDVPLNQGSLIGGRPMARLFFSKWGDDQVFHDTLHGVGVFTNSQSWVFQANFVTRYTEEPYLLDWAKRMTFQFSKEIRQFAPASLAANGAQNGLAPAVDANPQSNGNAPLRPENSAATPSALTEEDRKRFAYPTENSRLYDGLTFHDVQLDARQKRTGNVIIPSEYQATLLMNLTIWLNEISDGDEITNDMAHGDEHKADFAKKVGDVGADPRRKALKSLSVLSDVADANLDPAFLKDFNDMGKRDTLVGWAISYGRYRKIIAAEKLAGASHQSRESVFPK